MTQAAIYARVSTERQEEQKTIESQLAELREVCRKQEVHIVKEYKDDGWSGETLDRPALDQLRIDASKKIFERVYFHSNDRLSRNLTNQAIIVEELEKKGIDIFFFDKPIADTPEGRFLFQVLGAASEFERAKILERTRRGRLYKAKRGIVVGGIPPLGYNYVKKIDGKDGYYEINEEEAKLVNLIADLYLELGSIRAVAKDLTKRKIKPRQGQHWRTSTLHTILRNQTYIGTTYFNKYYSVEIDNSNKKYKRRIKTGRKMRDKKEWISISVPAIMTEEKFYTVQSLLVNNHKPPVSKYHYLLGGLIKCGNCGSSYTGEMNHNHFYYRCNNRHKTFPLPKKCNGKMVATSRLDNVVWDALSEALKNPKILISYILQTVKTIQQEEGIANETKEELIKKRMEIDEQEKRILKLYAIKGIEDDEQIAELISEYNKQKEDIDHQIEEIDIKSKQKIAGPIQKQDIEYFCQLAATRLDNLPFEEKHLILTRLIERIIFYSLEDRARIIVRIPLPEANKKITLDDILNKQYGTESVSSKRYVRQKRQSSMPFSLFPDF